MTRRTVLLFAMLVSFALAIAGSPSVAGVLGDVVFSSKASADYGPAYFPHWVHRIKYKCYACHDDIFPMKRGSHPTMDEMAEGKSCGACHNERLAFGLDACQRCHIGQ